jgi:hypothetical protein
VIRPARIAAVARLDLRTELKGRQGVLLPAILAGLLLPVAAVPDLTNTIAPRDHRADVTVRGAVPDSVLALPGVTQRPDGKLLFERREGVLMVEGAIRPDIRAALDGPSPPVTRVGVPRIVTLPRRTMFLGLLSSSILTGAVSASIGGERSRRTLVVLLSAAVGRAEIVLGKFAAWGGLGAAAALLAALTAVIAGHARFGWWLLPLPCVPLATVAIGLWLVRSATDVVGGTTTSLRVLPVVLALGGLAAWVLGSVHPWLGAAVPLGGAVVASGQMWSGPVPALIATASTLTLTAVCLTGTVRDLEETPDRDPIEQTMLLAANLGGMASLLWWIPVAVPVLWGLAGNQRLSNDLPAENGVLAGALGFLALVSIRVARAPRIRDSLGLGTPTGTSLAAGVSLGVLLALLDHVPLPALTDGPVLDAFARRLAAAFHPPWAGGIGALAVLADELLFRGVVLRAIGPVGSTLVSTIVRAPFDPLRGLLTSGSLAAVASRTGSLWPALAAHVVWYALS